MAFHMGNDGGSDGGSACSEENRGGESHNGRKNYHRHTLEQIQRLEEFFKECPHPDENQRRQLGMELGMEPRQIKFWFQNKRTQTKAQNERSDNSSLRLENDKFRCENMAIREALKNVICPSCGGPPPGKESRKRTLLKLQQENAELKMEYDRISDILANYMGRPLPGDAFNSPDASLTGHECGSAALEVDSMIENVNVGDQELSNQMKANPEIEKSLVSELASNAMDELIKLLSMDQPLWIKSPGDDQYILDSTSYEKIIPHPTGLRYPKSRMESSKDTGVVVMNARSLVDLCVDPDKWLDFFPTVVSKARTLHVIEAGLLGNRSGSLQLIYEQMHVLSPLVQPREFYVLHYCKQIDTGTWIIVKVSCDYLRDNSNNFPTSCWKRPSGCMIQVLSNGLSKDVSIASDGQSNELQGGKRRDIMLDSCISHSHHVEMERELQPWMPDEDDPQCPELENIFDSPWTGSWDQFKVNETLFGVKSTFNEDIYTTKLERVPQMREMEEEALRIAREIEGEETHDIHLAEERGTYPYGNFDVDEETKYSSVNRGVDDSGHADEDVMLNSYDTEGSKKPAGPAWSFADVTCRKSKKDFEGGQIASGYLSKDEIQSIQFDTKQEIHDFGALTSNHSSMDACGFEDVGRVQKRHIDEQGKACLGDDVTEDLQPAKTDGSQFSHDPKKDSSEKARVLSVSAKGEQKTSFGELSEDPSGQVNVIAEFTKRHGRPGNSASSTLNSGAATSMPSVSMLSPSSSMGSPSSEKLTLNPNAKEFKLNPKAKSFLPSQSPLRPLSPVNDGSMYYPVSVPSVQHMQGMPVGTGVGPSFAGYQPVLYNQQAAGMQSLQPYFPANGPQYGQPMIFGHPRQVMYMQGYPTEMPYKR